MATLANVLLVLGVVAFLVARTGMTRVPQAPESPPERARSAQVVRAPATPSPSRSSPTRPFSLIGQVSGEEITARMRPRIDSPSIGTFESTNEQGAAQVFLLEPEKLDGDGALPADQEWVRALLPIRPNQTSGYLPVEDLEVFSTDYRIEVDRSAFELTVYEGEEQLMEVPIGLGTGETPTPVGRFYLASLLQPPDPNTIYGIYAYGLSGYSETLTNWKGGGVIGLHGTNDPESIPGHVSHGCIRMLNEDIEKLVPLLPLGTPIQIT